jgi:hypothetical protein
MSARGRADLLRTLALVAVCAAAVALVRGRLFDQHERIRETSDVYPLPPPPEVVVMSLGYRSAFADVLWGHLLVSQGLHLMERRRYDNITLLLDAINELDPTFRDPYRLTDALVTFNSSKTPVEDVRKARAIMERGVKNRPLDAELWLGLGQFTAFVAPGSYLTDPAEQEQWRLDGARMLARAAELSGDNASVAWQAIGAARYLGRAGARDAEIRFLEHTMVVTDDEELKANLRARLALLLDKQRDAERAARFTRLERGVWDMRHNDVPFVTRLRYMALGPLRDPAACAGAARAREAACAPSFREWEERTEAARLGF